jgi:hypothetical protein
VLPAAAILFLGGCATLKQNYPEKNRFAPELDREAAAGAEPEGGILRVREFSVAPQYSGAGLVYRTGPMEYKTDYYNEFLVPPGALFAAITRQWLADSGLFRTVTGSDASIVPDYVLEANISALYGSVVPGEEPSAVLEMRFLLFRGQDARSGEYFQKTCLEKIPLEEVSARGVMEGWNRALQEILTDLEGAIRDDLEKETMTTKEEGGK